MKTLVVIDTVRESFDESGRKLSSLEAVAREFAGQPVVRESFTYEMIRYRGQTKKGCLEQLHADSRTFLVPIGTMDIFWG